MATFKFIRGKYTDDYIFENRDTALFAMTNDDTPADIPLDSINDKNFQEAIVGKSNSNSNSNRICDVATISPNQISNIELKYNTRNSTIEMGDSNKMTFMSPSNNVLKSSFITKAKEKISNATKSGNVTVNFPGVDAKSTVTFGLLNNKTFSKDFIFNVSGKIKESVYTKIIDGPQESFYDSKQSPVTGDFYFVNSEKCVPYSPTVYNAKNAGATNVKDSLDGIGIHKTYKIQNSSTDKVYKLSTITVSSGAGNLPDDLKESVNWDNGETLRLYEVNYSTPDTFSIYKPTTEAIREAIKSKDYYDYSDVNVNTVTINEKEWPFILEFKTFTADDGAFYDGVKKAKTIKIDDGFGGTSIVEKKYNEILYTELFTVGAITLKPYDDSVFDFRFNIESNSYKPTLTISKCFIVDENNNITSEPYSTAFEFTGSEEDKIAYKCYDDLNKCVITTLYYSGCAFDVNQKDTFSMSVPGGITDIYTDIEYTKPKDLYKIDSNSDTGVSATSTYESGNNYYKLSNNFRIYYNEKFYGSVSDKSPYYSLEVHENVPIDNTNTKITDNVPTPIPVTNSDSFIIRDISEFEIIGNMND